MKPILTLLTALLLTPLAALARIQAWQEELAAEASRTARPCNSVGRAGSRAMV